MFSKEDFKIGSVGELLEFLPIAPFVGLVAPLLLGAYTLGFLMDKVGWLDT